MRIAARLAVLVVALAAIPAAAGIGDPVPANPCGPANLSPSVYAILDVTGGGCAGGTGAETAITCTVTRGPSGSADLVVEIYDQSGAQITSGPVCVGAGLPVGTTLTLLTGALPPPAPALGPVIFTPFAPCGPGCFLHGSARVFSNGRLTCSAARIDLSAACGGGGPVPYTTKNLTVVRKAKQVGD